MRLSGRARYAAFALLSALLLSLGWVPLPLPFLLFVAFVPILEIEERLSQERGARATLALFKYSYLTFVVWNAFTTWWIYRASWSGAFMAIFANALLMTLPVLAFHRVKRHRGRAAGAAAFLCFWLAFEYLHLRWELAWPWLTLGNGLAMVPALAQWYEFTGTLGGSLWILAANLTAYIALRPAAAGKTAVRPLVLGTYVGILIVPALVSLRIGSAYVPSGKSVEVVVVQPNVDPYTEKFDQDSRSAQLQKLISLSDSGRTAETRFIVWPETSIPASLWLDRLEENATIQQIRQKLVRPSGASLVTGIFSYLRYRAGDPMSATARRFARSGECCYDAFNSAILVDSTARIQTYHKSKLVPGVERMPYPGLFRFLESFTISLGGISGSLGTQAERDVFLDAAGRAIAPVICYESVFGDYVADYIRRGAQAIFIVTNDGWWGNTPGHRQHLHYASLRAIETRRSIARSANTGISCFIDPLGRISQATSYDTPAVIRDTIKLSGDLTFYVRHGDVLGVAALGLSILLLLATFIPLQLGASRPADAPEGFRQGPD